MGTGSNAAPAVTESTVSILITLRVQLLADLADARISGARSWDAYSNNGTLIVSVPIAEHIAKLEASIADIEVSVAVDYLRRAVPVTAIVVREMLAEQRHTAAVKRSLRLVKVEPSDLDMSVDAMTATDSKESPSGARQRAEYKEYAPRYSRQIRYAARVSVSR